MDDKSKKIVKEVQGNSYESRALKFNGEIKKYSSKTAGSNKTGIHIDDNSLYFYGFESGRTIELKRFEFCRIKIYLKVGYFNIDDVDPVKNSVNDFVSEILKREEFGINNKEYSPVFRYNTVDILNKCLNRRIFVSYGLTLKGTKQFESHQVDIMEEIPISNGVDIVVEFESLSDRIASGISKEHSRIKSIGIDNGL